MSPFFPFPFPLIETNLHKHSPPPLPRFHSHLVKGFNICVCGASVFSPIYFVLAHLEPEGRGCSFVTLPQQSNFPCSYVFPSSAFLSSLAPLPPRSKLAIQSRSIGAFPSFRSYFGSYSVGVTQKTSAITNRFDVDRRFCEGFPRRRFFRHSRPFSINVHAVDSAPRRPTIKIPRPVIPPWKKIKFWLYERLFFEVVGKLPKVSTPVCQNKRVS